MYVHKRNGVQAPTSTFLTGGGDGLAVGGPAESALYDPFRGPRRARAHRWLGPLREPQSGTTSPGPPPSVPLLDVRHRPVCPAPAGSLHRVGPWARHSPWSICAYPIGGTAERVPPYTANSMVTGARWDCRDWVPKRSG